MLNAKIERKKTNTKENKKKRSLSQPGHGSLASHLNLMLY